MRILELILRICVLCCYLFVRSIFCIIQGIVWRLNGTHKAWKESKNSYSRSAHVQNIIFRHKLDPIVEPSVPSNFITTHQSFQHADYVRKPNVTLFTTTLDEAIFVETDPNIDAVHSDTGSFLRAAQYRYAKNLIAMPLQHFHTLAENIGSPKGKLVFLSNTTRCGSTLICQIFESTGHCIGISEPDALNAINIHTGKVSPEVLDRLVVSSVNMLCKPIGRDIAGYAIKTSATTIEATPLYKRLFPDSIHLFMYREGKKVAPSAVKMGTTCPVVALINIGGTIHPAVTRKLFEGASCPPGDFNVSFKSSYALFAYIWALIIRKYVNFRQQGIEMNAVKFEHLVDNPKESVCAILKYCQLPEAWTENGIKALEKDSQRASLLSARLLKGAYQPQLTDAVLVECDAICKRFNLQPFLTPLEIEGTITSFSNQK